MWYRQINRYNGILLSHKKNEIMPFAATWMHLEIIILTEVSQTGKEKYQMVQLICGIKKKIRMNLFTRKKQTHRHRKQTYGYQGGGGINWKIGNDIYTLLYIKQITDKDLLYSTGNSTQYSVMAYMGKES